MAHISALQGVRVLDFTRILAGPYCSMILGDMGADIIKVERTKTGDETRHWHPPSVGDQSAYFMCVNRNKKSLTLNLKKQKGQEIAKKLAQRSDVLLENFIPGTMDAYGLGYEQLRGSAPGLVYCSISGYGQTGPYAQRGGYDVIASAIGGLINITGSKDGEPCKAGVALTDLMTGLYAHGAIIAALRQRDQHTKTGQHIDCNLLSTQISSLVNIGANYLNGGVEASRWGTAHQSIVPYQAFRTKDGKWLVIGAGNAGQFGELCARIGMEELPSDPRFTDNTRRVQNRDALIEILQARFLTKTCRDWETTFADSTLPVGPVNNMDDAFSHPQVEHNRMIQTVEHPSAGRIKVTGPAVKFSNSVNEIRSSPPCLGEHNEEILSGELGYSQMDIDQLRMEGII